MSSDEGNWIPGEVNWDYYRSDLNVSKMAIKAPRPIINFEIPVKPQLPRYRPGSGPPSQPVELRLKDDSTAFIIDKVILPPTDLVDPRQRRAYYILGWPDLPAARPVVDCAKALEYVAPYVIEQWEHKDFLRREAEKEQAETEAALAAVAEAIAAEKGKAVVGANTLHNGKKKPGRKPKNARRQQARLPTPQLDSEQEELLAKRRQGPSLSTPQKKESRIAQLEAEMEMGPLDHSDEFAESDEEIRRQLETELLREPATSLGGEEEDDVDLLQAGTGAPNVASFSRGGSVIPPAREAAVQQRRNKFPPKLSHSAGASSQQQRSSYIMTSHPSQIQRPVSTTPIPLPKRPGLSYTSNVMLSHRPSAVPSTELRTLSMQGQVKKADLATPVLKSGSQIVQAISPSSSAQAFNGGHGGFTPTNSFTTIGGHFPRPPKRPADESPFARDSNEGIPSSAKTKGDRKKKAPKLLQPPSPSGPAAEVHHMPEAEQEYVVKRLEDDSIVDGIHWFKVRWEGEWPPDQNPTWEPRDNISADLVKSYLKRKAEKARNASVTSKGGPGSSRGKPKEKRQSTLQQWASSFNYSSVSEAFEGQAELDQINQHTYDNHRAEEDDNDELGGDAEEFLVVDKRKADKGKKAEAESRKSFSSQLAADFAGM